ncbi:MAG: hypothetical protein KDK39_10560 [Leptospiraceae bacterium]|nr:hypothetical protein [Leptospiraceae bacterium]
MPKTDQERLDRILRVARRQIPAGVMAAQPNPFDTMALAIMLDLQSQIDELRLELQRLIQTPESLLEPGQNH